MAPGIEEVVSGHSNTMKMVQANHQTSNQQVVQQTVSQRKNVGVMGSRRIFAAAFKLKVLDSYRNDIDCRGNQRATARKYGIHRRQIQKWLQCEDNLRSSCAESNATTTVTSSGCCEVPIGGNSGISISPGSIVAGTIDVTSKVDTITSSSSSSLSNSSSSLINSNTRSPIVNCNVIGSIGITTSSGTSIPAPAIVGTTAAAAAPALNLSLARLHGDEQQHQRQAAPPPHHPSVPSGTPMRHSVRRASSPLQYIQHNNNNNNNNHHHQVPSSSSAPLRGMQLTYENTKRQQEMLLQQHHHQQPSYHQRHLKRQQNDNNHQINERLVQDNSCTPEIKYSYVMPRSNYENNDIFTGTSLSQSTNTDDYYQTLESYHKNIVYGGNKNNVKEIGTIDETFSSYRDTNLNEAGNKASLQYEQTSFPSCSASTLLLVNHHHHEATTIKSERASPDSLATQPGPFETPGSPESASTMPRPRNRNDQHQHHQRSSNQLDSRVTLVSTDTRGNNTNVCTNTSHDNVVVVANAATESAVAATAAIATNAASAVHSNETTRLLAHVHVGVNSHTCDSRVSEKLRGRRRRRQEDERELRQRENIKIEYDEQIREMRVKEEITEIDEIENTVAIATGSSSPIATGMTTTMMMMMPRINDEPKTEITDQELHIEDSRYHRETTRMPVIATCPDYQSSARTSNDLSSVNSSESSSPIVRHTAETYSGLSSPRTASSSGISTSSSCSDSEIDPLDYSSNSARNVINDLSRRRSFSLRFKLDVLDAFHSDVAVAGNQRATARKFGINRRQVQKWLGQESELRGEIALRGGDLRQRLGPMPEPNNNSAGDASLAVDLRTSSSNISTPISGMRSDTELENNNNLSSSPLYCCDIDSSSQRYGYYDRRRCSLLVESPEIQSGACSLSCCQESINGSSIMCYQETPNHRRSSSGYPESQDSLYCYSPRETSENEAIDVTISVSTLKRSACGLNCCYDMSPSSPKRICTESLDKPSARSSPISQEQSPPQEVPLCLVKPKSIYLAVPMQQEPVTSTVPTPPAQNQASQPAVITTTNKKDAILFKPYLDNPVSKPNEDKHVNLHNKHGGLSPISGHSVIVNNNNNNCHGIRNMNEEQTIVSQQTDYALELSLRVPASWGIHHGGYGEFPEHVRSAFVRYPTSPHYT